MSAQQQSQWESSQRSPSISDCHLHGRRYQGVTTKLQYMDEHCFIEQESNRIAKLEHLADRRNMRGGAQRGQSPFLWRRRFCTRKQKSLKTLFLDAKTIISIYLLDNFQSLAISSALALSRFHGVFQLLSC